MHQYQYQTREVNTPYKYILPVFTGAKYKCEIQMYEINANDHHGPLHSVITTCIAQCSISTSTVSSHATPAYDYRTIMLPIPSRVLKIPVRPRTRTSTITWQPKLVLPAYTRPQNNTYQFFPNTPTYKHPPLPSHTQQLLPIILHQSTALPSAPPPPPPPPPTTSTTHIPYATTRSQPCTIYDHIS